MGGSSRLANLPTPALPYPRFPALCRQDTTSAWSPDCGGYITRVGTITSAKLDWSAHCHAHPPSPRADATTVTAAARGVGIECAPPYVSYTRVCSENIPIHLKNLLFGDFPVHGVLASVVASAPTPTATFQSGFPTWLTEKHEFVIGNLYKSRKILT